jgi:hypothetical protein
MTGEWYFERWRADGEAAFISHTTKDFSLVLIEASAAVAAGEIFHVRPRSAHPMRSYGSLQRLSSLMRLSPSEVDEHAYRPFYAGSGGLAAPRWKGHQRPAAVHLPRDLRRNRSTLAERAIFPGCDSETLHQQ